MFEIFIVRVRSITWLYIVEISKQPSKLDSVFRVNLRPPVIGQDHIWSLNFLCWVKFNNNLKHLLTIRIQCVTNKPKDSTLKVKVAACH